jgi:hypothetical protein
MLKANDKDQYKNHMKKNLLDLFELFENINQIFDDFHLYVENIHIQDMHNVYINEDMYDILLMINIFLLLFEEILNELLIMMDLKKIIIYRFKSFICKVKRTQRQSIREGGMGDQSPL